MKVLLRILAFIPAIAVMVTIFLLSAEPATESSKTSHPFVEVIAEIITKDYGKLTDAEKEAVIESIHDPIRKCAHVAIYCVLGVTLFFAYKWVISNAFVLSLVSWLTAVVYAASDEYHQYFIPGRSCELRDIIIDASGALFGVLFCVIILLSARARRRKRSILY